MGQNASNSTVEHIENIDPKDQDRVMIFKYSKGLKDIKFEKWNVFKNKYALSKDLRDPKSFLRTDTEKILKTNNPKLIAKIAYIRSPYFAWQQWNLMKCTNILYYTNVFKSNVYNLFAYCFVMEKLSYTLYDYVTENNKNIVINEEDTKLIIFDLLNCLYLIHSLHYIHTDITSCNVMYRANDFVGDDGILYKKGWCFIDYDLMIECHNIRGPKFNHRLNYGTVYDIEATPGWAQPEMASKVTNFRDCSISYAADLWSIGLLILFILFKKQPFQITGRLNIFNPIKLKLSEKELIKYLIDLKHSYKISSNLYNLLRGLLNFNPKKRMQSVQEVYNSPWFDSIRNTNINGENQKNILQSIK